MTRRPFLTGLMVTLVLLCAGPAFAQSQGEIDFLQRRIDAMRDPRYRRMAEEELAAAREALRQNNAEEFKRRSEAVMRYSRYDEFQYRR